LACSPGFSPYAVPANRIGPVVRTLVPTVAVVTANAAGNNDLGVGTALALGGPMALPSGTYAPRDPATPVLYWKGHRGSSMTSSTRSFDAAGSPADLRASAARAAARSG
jgi:hypothetical protein